MSFLPGRGGYAFAAQRHRLRFEDGFADDEAYWQRLHAAYSDDEIVDLTLCVAAWMAMGRVTHVLELDTVCMADMLAT